MASESFTAIISLRPSLSSTPQDNIFKFQVHCPISYYSYYKPDGFDLRRLLQTNPYKYGDYEFDSLSIDNNFRPDRTYIVTMVSVEKINKVTNKTDAELRYCGLTRAWNGSCKSPSYTCSSPGPMFDFNVNEMVDVVWVNLLNPNLVPNASLQNSCLDQSKPLDNKCSFETKSFDT